MTDTVTATTKAVHRRVLVPWLLVMLGATTIVSAGVYGFISIGSTGTGHLDTVPLGQQLTFKPSGSYRADIFTPRESLSTRLDSLDLLLTVDHGVSARDRRFFVLHAHTVISRGCWRSIS